MHLLDDRRDEASDEHAKVERDVLEHHDRRTTEARLRRAAAKLRLGEHLVVMQDRADARKGECFVSPASIDRLKGERRPQVDVGKCFQFDH